MSDDKKKYDSDDNYTNNAAYLTEDAKVFPSKEGKPPLVFLKFASESRRANDNEKVKTMWCEARVRDFDADAAAYLKKGDQLPVQGKPYLEAYDKNGGGQGYTLKIDGAKLSFTIELRKKLKERGWVPGAKGQKAAPAPKTKAPQRPVQDVNFGDEE